MERLGRLLSASASIFSNRDHQKNPQGENTEEEKEESFQNQNDDLMSTSDTSSHLWQGISGNMNYYSSRNMYIRDFLHNLSLVYNVLLYQICFLLDVNHTNSATLDKVDGNAPIAKGEDSLNSSTSGDEEQTDMVENGEETTSSTPQFDQSIRSGTPQAKLTLDSQNLRVYKELDDAFSSLDEELKQQSKSTI